MTPQAFIAKWRDNPLSEKAGAQSFFLDLCDLLGVAKPNAPDNYCLERGLSKTGAAHGWLGRRVEAQRLRLGKQGPRQRISASRSSTGLACQRAPGTGHGRCRRLRLDRLHAGHAGRGNSQAPAGAESGTRETALGIGRPAHPQAPRPKHRSAMWNCRASGAEGPPPASLFFCRPPQHPC